MSEKNSSKVIRCADYTFPGIERREYKESSSNFKAVCRYSLLGTNEGEEALNFHTRYFEVQPGGYSSLEFHRHPHTVVIIRGNGTVILGDEVTRLNLHDIVYVSPNTIHQFQADQEEPLGFICVVDRYRDHPTVPDEEQIYDQMGNSEAAQRVKK